MALPNDSDRMLKKVDKTNTAYINNEAVRILQANGVIIWGAFIVDPDWTVEDFKALRDYVTRKQITHTQFTILTPLPGTQLYQERYDELLTDDYTVYDTMHAVVPTKLPREEFYYEYSQLYRQMDSKPYLDLLHAGKMTIENIRQGREILSQMQEYRGFFEADPVLGTTGGKGRQPPPWDLDSAGSKVRLAVARGHSPAILTCDNGTAS